MYNVFYRRFIPAIRNRSKMLMYNSYSNDLYTFLEHESTYNVYRYRYTLVYIFTFRLTVNIRNEEGNLVLYIWFSFLLHKYVIKGILSSLPLSSNGAVFLLSFCVVKILTSLFYKLNINLKALRFRFPLWTHKYCYL